jgi:hypothetical protein
LPRKHQLSHLKDRLTHHGFDGRVIGLAAAEERELVDVEDLARQHDLGCAPQPGELSNLLPREIRVFGDEHDLLAFAGVRA